MSQTNLVTATFPPKNQGFGDEKFILIHIEFELKRPGKDFARRIYRYMCQLFLRYDVEIIPIVVFTDDVVWRKPVEHRFELVVGDKAIVRFEYHCVKLRSINYREFLNSRNPLAFALMAKMDYNRKEQARMKADFLRLILGCPVDPARKSLLVEFLETYVPLIGEELSHFEQLIQTEKQYAEVEQMVTVYEQRGIDKGMLAGKVQMIEQILGQPITDLKGFEKMSLEELQIRLESLQLILNKQNVEPA